MSTDLVRAIDAAVADVRDHLEPWGEFQVDNNLAPLANKVYKLWFSPD